MKAIPVLCAALGLAAAPAFAQLKGHPVSEGSGPLREISTNAGSGSPSVYDPGRNLRAGNAGTLSGNAVADSTTGTLKSGAFSDVSAGPVTAHRGVSGHGTPSDVSRGAVTRDADVPLRAALEVVPIEPVYDLGPLQEQLRAIEPLPREPANTAEEAEEDASEPETIAQGEEQGPEVRQVEPPDARDPGTLEQPEVPGVEEPRDVQQPPEPPVGAPREYVPIPMPGSGQADE